MLHWSQSSPDLAPRAGVLLLKPRRRRNSEAWLAVAILFVLLLGLTVGGDAPSTAPRGSGARPGSTMLVPPRPADIAVLLTNTPLAIKPEDALAINAARPLDRIKLGAARPFMLPASAKDTSVTVALDCLTKAVYYEAAVEGDTGQRAVAQVVLNRMRSPIFPHSVCGVVFQGSELKTGCQFSFTCDGSLMRRPSLTGWMRARRIALAALSGHVEPSVGLATHYHANYVVPYWASSLDKVSTIGAHIFYTMRGSLGRPGAFDARYDPGAELEPPPQFAGDPNNDLTNMDGTGAVDPLAGAKPRDRTVVREDLLGTLVRPDRSLPTPTTTLRADEARSGIVADETKGVLTRD